MFYPLSRESAVDYVKSTPLHKDFFGGADDLSIKP